MITLYCHNYHGSMIFSYCASYFCMSQYSYAFVTRFLDYSTKPQSVGFWRPTLAALASPRPSDHRQPFSPATKGLGFRVWGLGFRGCFVGNEGVRHFTYPYRYPLRDDISGTSFLHSLLRNHSAVRLYVHLEVHWYLQAAIVRIGWNLIQGASREVPMNLQVANDPDPDCA